MTIETVIYDELAATTAVTDIVSVRIYSGHVYDSVMPLLRYQAIGGIIQTHLRGESGLKNSDFQFDCYAETEQQSRTLAEAVRAALTGEHSAFNGVGVSAPRVQYEEDNNAHRASFDMTFWYT